MAAPPSSKSIKHTKPSTHHEVGKGLGGITIPLVVDPQSWTVLDPEQLGYIAGRDLHTTGSAKLSTTIRKGADLSTRDVIFVYNIASGEEKQMVVKFKHLREPRPDVFDETLFRSVLEKTLESAKEVRLQHQDEEPLSTGQFLRQVAEALADKANVASHEVSVEEGWQQLLERGLKSKLSLLKSKDFKSTSEASDLLGIGEHAIRKRIKEKRLFALRMPGDGEHRIPAWALDPKLGGATTAALLAQAKDADEWSVYHFMSTPNGSLNGLRPFECLMSDENLPPSRLGARDELLSYLRLPARGSLLETVKQALEADLAESPQT
jgi:hypothetical protein